MAGKNRSFLIGLILGGVIGSVPAIWIAGRMRQRFRGRGTGPGGRASEFATVARERGGEFLARVREHIRQAVEEGRESARKTRSEFEERFKDESEK